MPIPNIFLDTSALFSGIWSAAGGGRMLLKLGEAQAVKLVVSSQVLTEIETVLRRFAAQNLGTLALLLERSQIQVISQVPKERITLSQSIVHYQPDALVLAAAWTAEVNYFVTLDSRHLLDNEQLHQLAPFPVGTPGSYLAWYRSNVLSS